MNAGDEPWTVSADYENFKVIITAKKASERDIIHKRLRWTPGFTKIKKDLSDDVTLTIKCKTEKKMERKLAMILTTMNLLRIKLRK